MSEGLQCDEDFCRGGIDCCVVMADSHRSRRYCKVASQCQSNPYWEVITVPLILGLAALIIGLLVLWKLRKMKKKKLNVKYYAH